MLYHQITFLQLPKDTDYDWWALYIQFSLDGNLKIRRNEGPSSKVLFLLLPEEFIGKIFAPKKSTFLAQKFEKKKLSKSGNFRLL